MKCTLLFLFLSFILSTVSAQEKVVWKVSYNASAQEVELKATIAEGWHLYSQFIKNDIGPVPTSFVFNAPNSLKLEGPVAEPKPIRMYDPNFEADLDFFKDEVVFKQKIGVGSKGILSGTITFMVCNDQSCLPPVDVPFTITIP